MKNSILTIFLLFSGVSTYFASELFVKINSQTTYYAMISLQTQTNNSNVFRFFELPMGNNELKIYKNNSALLFYTGTIYIENNQRIICEIDAFGNLTVIKKVTISYQSWYESTESNFNGTNPNFGSNNNDSVFQDFMLALKDESFDSGKTSFAKSYVKKTSLSASQIGQIVKEFSFDSGKLEFAKFAFDYCFDKQNYFVLKENFSFSSTYSDLEKYVDGKQ
jgi:hypothetical protein